MDAIRPASSTGWDLGQGICHYRDMPLRLERRGMLIANVDDWFRHARPMGGEIQWQDGRWGNGDVEVSLSRIEDLPYVMGLIRQAFERQMDSAA